MSDNDLIRRGDAMHIVEGWRVLEDDIEALPAAPTFTAADLERAMKEGMRIATTVPIEKVPEAFDAALAAFDKTDP